MSWEVDGKAEVRIKAIAQALKSADSLILATDPDREGEAISWHISEELKRRQALDRQVGVSGSCSTRSPNPPCSTPWRHPREVNRELVEAYLARRALDYLVGFTLSPVLWRKLPGSRSAGPGAVGGAAPDLRARGRDRGLQVAGILDHRGGLRDRGRRGLHRAPDPSRRPQAGEVRPAQPGGGRGGRRQDRRPGAPFHVAAVERKTVRRHPFPSFTTSTLQQEASRKLGFSASHTMRLAQRLYEGVDHRRRDGRPHHLYADRFGVQLSGEAIAGSPAPDRGRLRRALSAGEARASTRPRPRTRRRPMRRSGRPTSSAGPRTWPAISTATSAGSTS